MQVGATARAIYRAYGVRWALLRIGHEVRKRRGAFLKAPSPIGAAVATDQRPSFALDLSRLGAALSPAAIQRAERVVRGEYQAFGDRWLPLPNGAAWQTHPHTGHTYPDVPWFRIQHVNAASGDIKDSWEPARFGWAYDLIRGYAATRDERFAEAFWTRFEDFIKSNPPFRGVQWSDGQEAAIRAVAWLWAESAFGATASRQRREMLCSALYATGERIADAINYALSQRNNHGLWECAGLAAIGARFLGAPQTLDWVRTSFKRFDRCVRDQFQPDGWYAQHSLTYTRVALQSAVVMSWAANAVGFAFGPRVTDRLNASARLVAALHDERSGDVPNYGANDGANPLPLSSVDYRDFRPAITAFACAFDQPVAAPFTPDAETEAWLGGRCIVSGTRSALVNGESGWVSARVGGAHLFARAGSYRARPGHLDPLHVELWNHGRPIAVDAGTFRYSAPPPWNDGLRITAVHNTIDVPALPIARRGPGFLSIGVPSARVISARGDGAEAHIVLCNDSWRHHDILHTREIELTAIECRVTDVVTGPPGTVAVLQWLTANAEDQPMVTSDIALEARQTVVDESAVTGWRSLYYASRTRAFSTTRQFVVPQAGTVALTSVFPLSEGR
jgi:hypothetical protein